MPARARLTLFSPRINIKTRVRARVYQFQLDRESGTANTKKGATDTRDREMQYAEGLICRPTDTPRSFLSISFSLSRPRRMAGGGDI